MSDIELRIECLRLAVALQSPDPIATAKKLYDFAMGAK